MTQCIDPAFSTTRRVSSRAPEIVGEPASSYSPQLLLPAGKQRLGEGGLRLQGYFKVGKNFNRDPGAAEIRPLITVVTIVFNKAQRLKKTMLSVLDQTYDNVEYIVIDGGSTDGTVDLIRQYQQAIDYWVSEPDGGIYAAMNKGITLSTGDYIYFLNADDSLISGSFLEGLAAEIVADKNANVLYYGKVLYTNGKTFNPGMSAKSMVINTVHHQGAFYSRSLFDSFRYNEQCGITADYELNLIIYLKRLPSKQLSSIVAFCEAGGVSQTSSPFRVNFENHLVRKRHIGDFLSLLSFVMAMINTWRRLAWSKRD